VSGGDGQDLFSNALGLNISENVAYEGLKMAVLGCGLAFTSTQPSAQKIDWAFTAESRYKLPQGSKPAAAGPMRWAMHTKSAVTSALMLFTNESHPVQQTRNLFSNLRIIKS
jgi:hypothetical protein